MIAEGIILTPATITALIDTAFVAGVKAVERAKCSPQSIEDFKRGQVIARNEGLPFKSMEDFTRERETQRTAEIQNETRAELFNKLIGGWASV